MTKEEIATLGGGCFWCIEAVFQRLEGVSKVVSGYSGGTVDNPSMNRVYEGDTGHAEVIQITFDPDAISYKEILEIFFVMHDPTTLNRQGNDVGDEYRSVIFYHNDAQKAVAEDVIRNYAKDLWDDPIVTEIKQLDKFWPADENNQDFFNKNPGSGYCQVIINPKIQKLRQEFAKKLSKKYEW
jgi:peptide-methionine (S)-S-oxide reductase